MDREVQEGGPVSNELGLPRTVVRADAASRTRRNSVWLPWGCGLLALLVLGLSVRNRELLAEVRDLTHRLQRAEQRPLLRGEMFPEHRLARCSGTRGFRPRAAGRAGSPAARVFTDLRCVRRGAPRMERDRAHGPRSSTSRDGVGCRCRCERTIGRSGPLHLSAESGLVGVLCRNLPAVPAALLVDANQVVHWAAYGTPHDGLRAAVEELLID